jgi:hypothetical protein
VPQRREYLDDRRADQDGEERRQVKQAFRRYS